MNPLRAGTGLSRNDMMLAPTAAIIAAVDPLGQPDAIQKPHTMTVAINAVSPLRKAAP